MKRRKMQKILVPDYADAWINRLTVIVQTIDTMESEKEREAMFDFILAKYSPRNVKSEDF